MNLSIICATYNTSTESVKPAASRVYVRTWWATVTALDALMGLCKVRAKTGNRCVNKVNFHDMRCALKSLFPTDLLTRMKVCRPRVMPLV